MSPGSIDSLENLSLTELVGLVRGLVGEVERLREENEKLEAALAAAKLENQQLKDEIRRLKGLPPRPPIKPSGMEKATDHPAAERPSEADGPSPRRRGPGVSKLNIDRTVTLTASAPAGSRHKGYEEIIVQDIAFKPEVTLYRCERWTTPDGRTMSASAGRLCKAIAWGPRTKLRASRESRPRLPWQLRHKPWIGARANWLLAKRIEADTRARHRTEEKIADSRLRTIRELERIAYSDIRDVVQWDREPELDGDGNVIGFKDTMTVTPSHLLTREQAAQVKSVTTKSGRLKFEVHDKLAALAQLAKILGVAPEPQPQTVNNALVNVQQVNFGGGENALESLRRLAFALTKLQQQAPLIEAAASHAKGASGPPK
jgi:hypothetical protein